MSYQDNLTFEDQIAITKQRWTLFMDTYFHDLIDIKKGEGDYYPHDDKYIIYNDGTLHSTEDRDEINFYEHGFSAMNHPKKVLLYVHGDGTDIDDLEMILKDLFNLEPDYFFTHEEISLKSCYQPFFGYNKQIIINTIGMQKYVFVLYNRVRIMFPHIFERLIFIDKMDVNAREVKMIDEMFNAWYATSPLVEEENVDDTKQGEDEYDYDNKDDDESNHSSSINHEHKEKHDEIIHLGCQNDYVDESLNSDLSDEDDIYDQLTVIRKKVRSTKIDNDTIIFYHNFRCQLKSIRDKIWKITPKKYNEMDFKMNKFIIDEKKRTDALNSTELKFQEIFDYIYNVFGVPAKGNALDMCSLPGGSVNHMLKLGFDKVYSHIYKLQRFDEKLTSRFYSYVEDKLVTLINPYHLNDGNLCNQKTVADCVNFCRFNDIYFNFIFADGAGGEGIHGREEENEDIILGEIMLSLMTLAQGGTLVIKVFDTYTENGLKMMMLLSKHFSEILPYYPIFSKKCSEEKYLICYSYNVHDDSEISNRNFTRLFDIMYDRSVELMNRYEFYYGVKSDFDINQNENYKKVCSKNHNKEYNVQSYIKNENENENKRQQQQQQQQQQKQKKEEEEGRKQEKKKNEIYDESDNSSNVSSALDESIGFIDYVQKCLYDSDIHAEVVLMMNAKTAYLIRIYHNNVIYYVSNRAFSLISFGEAQFYIICKNQRRLNKAISNALNWCDIKEIHEDISTIMNDCMDKVYTHISELMMSISGVERMIKTVNIKNLHGRIESSITQDDFKEYDMCVRSNKMNGVNSYLKYSLQGIIFPCGKNSTHLCSISLYSLGKYKKGKMPHEDDLFTYCSCGNVYVNKTLKFICEKSLHVMNELKFKNTGTLPISIRFKNGISGAIPKKVTPFTINTSGSCMSMRINAHMKTQCQRKSKLNSSDIPSTSRD